jgi:hypothetical protein
MVILDRIACGFSIISGRNPLLVNGISHSGIIFPQVPYVYPVNETLIHH